MAPEPDIDPHVVVTNQGHVGTLSRSYVMALVR
jgi:hypothetical protein